MVKRRCMLLLLLLSLLSVSQIGLAESGINQTCSNAIELLKAGKDLNDQPLGGDPTTPTDPTPRAAESASPEDPTTSEKPTTPEKPTISEYLNHDVAIRFMNACAITVTSSVGEKGLADNHCRDYKLNGVGNTCIATCKGDYGIKGVACVCKCTSMTDVRRDTVLGVMQLSNNVREWHAEEDNQCANSGLVVNGGTEVGHSRLNDQGHFAGYKLDFGTSYPENSCLTEYLYENWEFVGFRRNSSNGGNLKLNEISDGTITVGKERDNQPAQIKGICEAGKSTKYLPAGGGNAVTIHLGNHDGIQLDAKGANAVLEKPSSGTHWDITFLSSDVSPTGNKSSIDLPLQACNQVK